MSRLTVDTMAVRTSLADSPPISGCGMPTALSDPPRFAATAADETKAKRLDAGKRDDGHRPARGDAGGNGKDTGLAAGLDAARFLTTVVVVTIGILLGLVGSATASHDLSVTVKVGEVVTNSAVSSGISTNVNVTGTSTDTCRRWEFQFTNSPHGYQVFDVQSKRKTASATVALDAVQAAQPNTLTGSVWCRTGPLDTRVVLWTATATVPEDYRKSYSQAERDAFGRAWAVTGGVAGALGIGAVIATSVACPPCAIIGVLLAGAAGGFAIDSAVYGYLSYDPADVDFRVLVSPTPFPIARVATGSGLSARSVAAANLMLDGAADRAGLGLALVTSINRAHGASNAGDKAWETRQYNTARTYAAQLADNLVRAATLRRRLVDQLRVDGVAVPYTADTLQAARDTLSETPTAREIEALDSPSVRDAGFAPLAIATWLQSSKLATTNVPPAGDALDLLLSRELSDQESVLSGALRKVAETPLAGDTATPPIGARPKPTAPARLKAPSRSEPGALGGRTCLADTQAALAESCRRGSGLRGANFVALSPDGRFAYITARGDGALTAYRRNARTGRLTRLAGRGACFTTVAGTPGCQSARELGGAAGLAVAPNGRSVYVASRAGAVTAFVRNRRSGALRRVACVGAPSMAAKVCSTASGLKGAVGLIVSPDNRHVYVAAAEDGSVASFSREATGRLAPLGCVSASAELATACDIGGPLAGASSVTMSPDGRSLYAAGHESGTVVQFIRGPGGRLRQAGCIGGLRSDAACAPVRGISAPEAVLVTPDGRGVYVASSDTNAVVALQRDVKNGELGPAAGGLGSCITDAGIERDADCDANRGLQAPYGLGISPDGTNLYVGSYRGGSLTAFARSGALGTLRQIGRCLAASDISCRHASSMARTGHVVVSPDGRTVYAAAPNADAISIVARRSTPTLPRLAKRTLLTSGKKLRVPLICSPRAPVGCYGTLSLRQGKRIVGRANYDLPTTARQVVKVALRRRAGLGVTTLRVKAIEPAGRSRSSTTRIRVRTRP